MVKIITPQEAAQLISDGDTIALGGFGAHGAPDALFAALAQRYQESGGYRHQHR